MTQGNAILLAFPLGKSLPWLRTLAIGLKLFGEVDGYPAAVHKEIKSLDDSYNIFQLWNINSSAITRISAMVLKKHIDCFCKRPDGKLLAAFLQHSLNFK